VVSRQAVPVSGSDLIIAAPWIVFAIALLALCLRLRGRR
jgi:hypothetical protein